MRQYHKRASAFALVCALIFSSSSAAFASEHEVVFEGAGWGHGVGLSQYGMFAMEKLGYSHDEILKHYFQGTEIEAVDPLTAIWVNLLKDFTSWTLHVEDVIAGVTGSDVTVTWEGGASTAVSGAVIRIDQTGDDGCRVTITNPGEDPQVLLDPAQCSMDMSWYQWNSGAADPSTMIRLEECALADWNAGQPVPCRYAFGTLHLRQHQGLLDLSAEMLLDDYVHGVSEIGTGWGPESQRAQAIAARSYAEARRIGRGTPGSNSCGAWCHVRDTSIDQRYVGWGHLNRGPWEEAVAATANQVLTHESSELGTQGVIAAFYSSSTGGATEFSSAKWGRHRDWLVSRYDGWAIDGTVNNRYASWSVSVSPADVASALGWDYVTAVEVVATRPGSGSADQVRYRGLDDGAPVTEVKTSAWTGRTFGLRSHYFEVDYELPPGSFPDPEGDEILLYRDNGSYQYNSLLSDGGLGFRIREGTEYTNNWKSITGIDLDGDGQDEIMFYRDDGLFRYYDIAPSGKIGSPLASGDGYTRGWGSIAAVDLDGDGQDEIMFYRDDGLFRYYEIAPSGKIGSPLASGDGYTRGWTSITAVDLDGNGQDEMFFYRSDGLYRYYDVRVDGSLPSPLLSGSDYPTGWETIRAADLDGDGQDEMLFYKDDGTYEFYDVSALGSLGDPIDSGSDFGPGWSVLAPLNLDGR